jgi:ArsR family transcriptional regulator, arsenate/arsenite/antimonite-responsive transcriptional repressor
MNLPQTVSALGALAHEARLAVFKLLVQAGPEGLPAGVIAERLNIAPSALTFHLKELTFAGLLSQRPDGRKIHYSANFSAMNELIGYLTQNCCSGQACELDGRAAECC